MRHSCAAGWMRFRLPAGTSAHERSRRLPGAMRRAGGEPKRTPARIDPVVMKALRATLLVVCVTVVARDPGLAADAAYGEYLASECVTCHGAPANASIPTLQALPYDELIAALKAYREGSRTNAVMQSVTRSLGDAEIEALAAYFSGQP